MSYFNKIFTNIHARKNKNDDIEELEKYSKILENERINLPQWSQIKILYKIGECLLLENSDNYDISQEFLFRLDTLNPRFRDILKFVEDYAKSRNLSFINKKAYNDSITQILEQLEGNRNLFLSNKRSLDSTSLNILLPDQLLEIINQILIFYVNYHKFSQSEYVSSLDASWSKNVLGPFFSCSTNEISMAGRFFRCFISLMIRFDHQVLLSQYKLKNIENKDEKKKIKALLYQYKILQEKVSDLLFDQFIYQINNLYEFEQFFKEYTNHSTTNEVYFDFVFPINYSNYPVISLLSIIKFDNLNHFNPIEKLLNIEKYHLFKDIKDYSLKVKKNNDIQLKNSLLQMILFPQIDNSYYIPDPIQYGIVNSNLKLIKYLYQHSDILNIIFNHQSEEESDSLKNYQIELNDYKGYSVSSEIENPDGFFEIVVKDIPDIPFNRFIVSISNKTDYLILSDSVNAVLNSVSSFFNESNLPYIYRFINQTKDIISQDSPQCSLDIINLNITKDQDNNQKIKQILESKDYFKEYENNNREQLIDTFIQDLKDIDQNDNQSDIIDKLKDKVDNLQKKTTADKLDHLIKEIDDSPNIQSHQQSIIEKLTSIMNSLKSGISRKISKKSSTSDLANNQGLGNINESVSLPPTTSSSQYLSFLPNSFSNINPYSYMYGLYNFPSFLQPSSNSVLPVAGNYGLKSISNSSGYLYPGYTYYGGNKKKISNFKSTKKHHQLTIKDFNQINKKSLKNNPKAFLVDKDQCYRFAKWEHCKFGKTNTPEYKDFYSQRSQLLSLDLSELIKMANNKKYLKNFNFSKLKNHSPKVNKYILAEMILQKHPYKKDVLLHKHPIIFGLKGKTTGTYHHFLDYRTFQKQVRKIPSNYIEKPLDNYILQEYYCGTQQILDPQSISKVSHPNSQVYLTHDNGGRPFAVYLSHNKVWVYRIPKNSVILASSYDSINQPIWAYIELVYHSQIIKSWVPDGYEVYKSNKNPDFTGNCILIKTIQQEYVFIGEEIVKIKIDESETIIDFMSIIGDNDIPFPIIFGSKHTYLLGLGDKVIDPDKIYHTKNERLKYLQDEQFNYRYSFDPQKTKKLKILSKTIVSRIFG